MPTDFLISLVGAGMVGLLAGYLLVTVSGALHGLPFSEFTLSLALPNLLYPLAEHWLHVSGVVAVVCAGLTVGKLLHARRPAAHQALFRQMWQHLAGIASAAVFLLAALHVPVMLRDLRPADLLTLGMVTVAAIASRFATLSVCLPILTKLGACKPVPRSHRLLLAWGGVRGPVTLTLALCVARNQALPPDARHFAAVVSIGFVMLNLLCNGLTLGPLMRRLGIVPAATPPTG